MKAILLFLIHIIALYGIIFITPSNYALLLTLLMYALTGFGITIGYHRLWSHKSFSANNLLQGLLAFFGAGALQGSIIWWSRLHRLHHNQSDTEHDPYGPQKGFLHCHIKWIIENRYNSYLEKINVDDLKTNKIVMFQHKYYTIISLISSFLFPLILMNYDFMMTLCYPFALARIIVWHSTWFVNSLAHTLGTQTYGNSGSSKDHFITALLTFGEGYHNFHHEYPYDYRNAIKWYQYDPTQWLIKLFSYFGLTYNLKKVNNNIIFDNLEDTITHKIDDINKYENYIIVSNILYDITELIKIHPGGNIIKSINKINFKDFDELKHKINNLNIHSNGALKLLKTYKIGSI